MNNALYLVGIAKKAGRLDVGEEPVGASARAGQAKLILLAGDAAANSVRRATHFAQAGKVPWIQTPFTKAELGGCVGRTACAMLALTDIGLAAAIAEKLAANDPDHADTAQMLGEKAEKALQRQKEQRVHERRMREGKKRPWAPPPREGSHLPRSGEGAHGPKKAVTQQEKFRLSRKPEGPGKTPAVKAALPKRPTPRGVITIKKKTP